MDKNSACAVCRKETESRNLRTFFVDFVCPACHAKLKKIECGGKVRSRNILEYYINAQAMFFYKDPCPCQKLTSSLNGEQLSVLSQWFLKLSRTALGK